MKLYYSLLSFYYDIWQDRLTYCNDMYCIPLYLFELYIVPSPCTYTHHWIASSCIEKRRIVNKLLLRWSILEDWQVSYLRERDKERVWTQNSATKQSQNVNIYKTEINLLIKSFLQCMYIVVNKINFSSYYWININEHKI